MGREFRLARVDGPDCRGLFRGYSVSVEAIKRVGGRVVVLDGHHRGANELCPLRGVNGESGILRPFPFDGKFAALYLVLVCGSVLVCEFVLAIAFLADFKFGDDSLADDDLVVFASGGRRLGVLEYLDDGLAVLGDIGGKLEDILVDDLQGVLEGGEEAVVVGEMLGDGHGTSLQVGVVLDEGDEGVDHHELWLLGLREPVVLGEVLGEVGIHPDLDFAIVVDADEVVVGLEVADEVIELLEAEEAVAENVYVLGVGDVGDVAEADGDVLDVDLGAVQGGAELLEGGVAVVDGVDDVVFADTHEEAVVVVECLLVGGEVQFVLIDFLVGDAVAVGQEVAVFFLVVLDVGGDLDPLALIEVPHALHRP